MLLHVWEFNVEEKKFYQVRIIDNATSIIWTTRYNAAGDFELYIPADKELISLFGKDGIIITRDDTDRVMYVESLKLTTNAEDGDYLTISGRSVECIIGRRIVNSQTILDYDTAESALKKLLEDNLISPSDTMRRMSFVRYGLLHGWQDAIRIQITGKNLLDAITDICVNYNYGYKLTFRDVDKLVFDTYKGVDRTLSQNTNTHVIFSAEFENLGNTEYVVDRTEFCNWAYVAGEGEGTSRKVGQAASILEPGLFVFEKWFDARNVSSNNGEISHATYMQMLRNQAAEEIELAKVTKAFSGEILNINAYTYGVDYDLGDKVSIVNEYGIQGNATITEISEVEDETGYRLIPTLSEWDIA